MSVDMLWLLMISLRGTASKNVPAAPAFVGQPKLLPPVKILDKVWPLEGVNPQECVFQSSNLGVLKVRSATAHLSSVYLETETDKLG